jgi:hypothetical protein
MSSLSGHVLPPMSRTNHHHAGVRALPQWADAGPKGGLRPGPLLGRAGASRAGRPWSARLSDGVRFNGQVIHWDGLPTRVAVRTRSDGRMPSAGSIHAARCAGIQHAPNRAPAIAVVPLNVEGSVRMVGGAAQRYPGTVLGDVAALS